MKKKKEIKQIEPEFYVIDKMGKIKWVISSPVSIKANLSGHKT